ncbi:ras GEF [Marasmius fiardii PR-910]|nr:ras GEF [Marasmius fiardii PR-910]
MSSQPVQESPLPPPTPSPQPTSSAPKLLPIPAPSTTVSRAFFTYPENEEAGGSISTGLPPEIASADISIAPDGSFVETSQSAAALELKKRYDTILGVNPPSVRSPYVITAFINQHGKRMFRIGHRDMSAPAAAGHSVEDQIINRASSSSTHPRHRPTPSNSYTGTNNSSRSRRQSRLTALLGSSNPKNKNKLRKPRSNPDLQQQQAATTSPTRPTAAAGVRSPHSTMPTRRFGNRTHSLSVTAIDQHQHPTNYSTFVGGREPSYVYGGGSFSSSVTSPSTSTTSTSHGSGHDTLSPPRNNYHHHSNHLNQHHNHSSSPSTSASGSRSMKKGDVFSEVMNWNRGVGGFHPHHSGGGSTASFSGSISGFGIGMRRDRNNSSASAASYISPSSVSSHSSSVSGGGIGEFGEVISSSAVSGGGRIQRSGSTATDGSSNSYLTSESSGVGGYSVGGGGAAASASSQQLILKPFGNHVVFEPRWRPKPPKTAANAMTRGRKKSLGGGGGGGGGGDSSSPSELRPSEAESVSASASSGLGNGSSANNRVEERRRKSQSWSGAGVEPAGPEADMYSNGIGISGIRGVAGGIGVGISNINTGYISDAHSDVDGEEEGREEFELWSAYFDTHITGAAPPALSSGSNSLRGKRQGAPKAEVQGGGGESGQGHQDTLGKGKEKEDQDPDQDGGEEEESDYSKFLRVGGASARLRNMASFDSVMTARQGRSRSSSDNLREAAVRTRRRVGKVDEGEEADREDFASDDNEDLELSEVEVDTPPRPPSAIRMRPHEEKGEGSVPKIALDVDEAPQDHKGDSDPATATTTTSTSAEAESDSQTLSIPPSLNGSENDSLPHTPRPSTNQTIQPTQPLPTTLMHTRFSTGVFDVLQTYRGLPLLDKLEKKKRTRTTEGSSDEYDEDDNVDEDDDDDDNAEDAWVIRLSLQDDESAAPRNDPRFVIWGQVNDFNEDEEEEGAVQSNTSHVGRSSVSRTSSVSVGGDSESAGSRSRGGSMSKKKAIKEMKKKEKEARSRSGSGTAGPGVVEGIPLPTAIPSSSVTPTEISESTPTGSTHPTSPPRRTETAEKKKKQILAATIERWLAQLTSEYNYDELLVFFLTYRTYISPLDLAHLFICRFHWALTDESGGTGTGGGTDDRVKGIVRLRTFVAVQYWMNTFFSVDFLHNRELRVLVASWLNAIIKDPILGRYPDALIIIKKIRKVAKERKRKFVPLSPRKPPAEESVAPVTSPWTTSHPVPTTDVTETSTGKEHLLGRKFAEATREFKKQRALEVQQEDSDVDLDFLPEQLSTPNGRNGLHINTTGLPLSSISILQRTDLAPSPSSADMESFIETSHTLPVHHNLLSKVIGSLGRWKRVLNNHRSMSRMTTYGGYGGEGFGMTTIGMGMMELRSHGNRNMWEVRGGMESYLRVIEQNVPPRVQAPPQIQPPPLAEADETPSTSTSRDTISVSASSRTSVVTTETSEPSSPSTATPSVSGTGQAPSLPSENSHRDSTQVPPVSQPDTTDTASLASRASYISIATSSTDSLGVPLSASRASAMFPAFHSPWQFDVVSIDQLSDTSSNEEPNLPPGLAPELQHRTPRRLPTRRVMEVNNEDRSTVSSMGIVSRDSYASTTTASSTASSPVAEDAGQGLGKGIQQWQLNQLVDSLTDDEEAGDVEDALKRLEGHINPQKQREKANKVEGWVRTIRQKLAAGDYDSDERPRWEEEEDEEDESAGSTFEQHLNGGDTTTNNIPSIVKPQSEGQDAEQTEVGDDGVAEPVEPPTLGPISPPRATSDAKPAVEDVVPIEILQSRVSEVPPPAPTRPSISIQSNFVNPPHHSFVLGTKADTVAQHFAMIDRDLFCALGFEELLAGDWMNCEEIEVLDWNKFMNDCARWRAESRWPERTGALGNIRARFNLVANFAASEVVLTHPNERAQVFVKLLHVAWRSYHRNSLNTVVAIITGLQSKLVTQAMRRSMGRLSSWDARIFRDLKLFIANTNCFQYLREAIERIMDAKPIDNGSHVPPVVNGSIAEQPGKGKSNNKAVPSACIPFIGVYLSQLYQHHQLPDLIDPTAPNEVVGIDPITSNFDSPAHPEVFDALAPLPPAMQLEPLINVQKQRLIAGVVNRCITGQQLANRVRFPINDDDMHKACLELKALNSETLQRVLLALPG